MEKKKIIVTVEALLAVLVWGASFIATKVALRNVLPVTIVWLRFALGLIILGAVVLFRRQMALPNLKEMGYFAFLGFLGITFHQWLQSTGLETAQATTTSWILSSVPIFIAGHGFSLKKKWGWLKWGEFAWLPWASCW
jgi:drug/metabolite transporter (DMT)-like permease